MPLLPFSFLFKSSSCSHAIEAGSTDPSTPAQPEQSVTAAATSHAGRRSAQDWTSVDLFYHFHHFYEAQSTGQCKPLAETAVSRVEELSTAELIARLLHLLIFRSHHENESSAVHADAAGFADGVVQRHASLPHQFVAELQRLIAAHRTMTQMLRSRAAVGCPPLDALSLSKPSTTASAMVVAPHQRRAIPICSDVITDSFTQVVGTNLYVISTFLEALNEAQNASASSPCWSRQRCAHVKSVLCTRLFYLVTLTLDLADAAALFESDHVAATTFRASRLTRVLQEEGSHVLTCLLRMSDAVDSSQNNRLADMSDEPHADTSASTCRWVVTHHLLRRLLPLLFSPLLRGSASHINDGDIDDARGTPQGDATSAVGGDRTDLNLVVWMAECLQRYSATSPSRRHHSEGETTAFSPLLYPTCLGFTVHESLECSCVVRLLRGLAQQLDATLYAADNEESSAAGTEEGGVTAEEAAAADMRSACGKRRDALLSAGLAEYASVLGPILRRLPVADSWEALPPPLRDVVRAVEFRLLRFEELS
jgi:hypothetical protein